VQAHLRARGLEGAKRRIGGVDMDYLVEGVGNWEAKAIDWSAKTYQTRSRLVRELTEMVQQLNRQQGVLLKRGLNEKLHVWFRNVPSESSLWTQNEIETFLRREVQGLDVIWGLPQ